MKVSIVKDFLLKHATPGLPLLLGLSGGPDSMALLHLLLEARFTPVEAAHVDHGWREESGREARLLEDACHRLSVPFHFCQLKGQFPTESEARIARLSFFKQLFKQKNYQALVLGHQEDDQAETVLKRILEGASLTSLGGICPLQHFEGMPIWRPLLSISKEELVLWLSKKGISFFKDPTNLQIKFLRGRLRSQIFPDLEEKFGKNIRTNLSYLGSYSQELKAYLMRKIDPLWASKTEDGIDLTPFFPIERIELKMFLKCWSDREKLNLCRSSLEIIEKALIKGCGFRKIIKGNKEIIISKRRLIVAIKK